MIVSEIIKYYAVRWGAADTDAMSAAAFLQPSTLDIMAAVGIGILGVTNAGHRIHL